MPLLKSFPKTPQPGISTLVQKKSPADDLTLTSAGIQYVTQQAEKSLLYKRVKALTDTDRDLADGKSTLDSTRADCRQTTAEHETTVNVRTEAKQILNDSTSSSVKPKPKYIFV